MLTDAQFLSQLNAGDAFTGYLKDVNGVEPFSDRYAGVLQEDTSADGKLAPTAIAVVPGAVLDRRGAIAVAAWANYAFRPAHTLKIGDSGGFVGGLFEEFKGAELAAVLDVHDDCILIKLLW